MSNQQNYTFPKDKRYPAEIPNYVRGKTSRAPRQPVNMALVIETAAFTISCDLRLIINKHERGIALTPEDSRRLVEYTKTMVYIKPMVEQAIKEMYGLDQLDQMTDEELEAAYQDMPPETELEGE